MDLFDHSYQQQIQAEAPLADRLRPQTLEQFVGQDHIIGAGRLLRRAIEADQLSSLIFFGPPGTGKTTLARIIARTTRAHFIAINAVLAGVKDLREAIATATDLGKYQRQKTILFVDEVHRFNKSQQDALLPWVENGTIILIGATTENPFFEVNKALVSRSRLFQLQPLTQVDLDRVIDQALTDRVRGYGQLKIQLEPAARDHLTNVANGDARSLLNALELAVTTTPPNQAGLVLIDLAVAEESIQQRAVLYDKEGDAHFDTISAFIKSIRGSDPDAALYWLAKMVYAGEDPRFMLRRLLILASEDVGLADPHAVTVVNSCAQAFDRVGMPEGRYPLAQATLYLANAPKSNSIMGFFDALAAVEQEQQSEMPNHLKDANRDKKGLGHGANYLYPHAYRDHWVEQQYLPSSLQGRVFYQPSAQGQEAVIQHDVARRREAQLAAQLEAIARMPGENLTYSTAEPQAEQWLQRAVSQVGQNLAVIRDRLFELAQLQRHHLVLDLNAKTGLLTWEALRQVPEGGVYSCVVTEREKVSLQEQGQKLPGLLQPEVMLAKAHEIAPMLTQQLPELRFENIVGRNVLTSEPDKVGLIQNLMPLLQASGHILLAEHIPQHTQRLYQLLQSSWLDADLWSRLQAAEEAIYQDATNPLVNWDENSLSVDLQQAGLQIEVQPEQFMTVMLITPALIKRWFGVNSDSAKTTYRQHLLEALTNSEIDAIANLFRQRLCHQSVSWSRNVMFLKISAKN